MNLFVNPPQVLKRLFNKVVWEIKTDAKQCFLTFDDGPTPKITEWVLDILSYYNAKATFFLLGKNVEANFDIFQKIKNQGHSFGNHTFNHLNGWKHNDAEYLADIDKTDQIIKTDLFRPPYGKIKCSQLNCLLTKKKVILWNLLTKDYDKNIGRDDCFALVKKYMANGSILVFHDSIKAEHNMKYVLEQTLLYYTKLGYQFSKIE